MIIAAFLSAGALLVLAGLIFHLSVYALPLFVGIAAASFAHGSGAGLVGAGLVGLAAGALIQAAGQTAFGLIRSPVIRLLIVGLFAAPAAIAGYAVVDHVAAWAVPGLVWRTAFAVAGAIVTGAVAWTRISTFAPPGGPGGRFGATSAQLPGSA